MGVAKVATLLNHYQPRLSWQRLNFLSCTEGGTFANIEAHPVEWWFGI